MLAVVAPLVEAQSNPGRMNVLFLVCDDMNTLQLGDTNRYAGKFVAPNIRKLADSGVLFERAYAAAPICCPSRTAFFSGVSPVKSGHYTNRADWKEGSLPLQNAVSLATTFKQAGYSTFGYGKITHSWDQKEGWDEHVGHKRDPAPPGAPLTASGGGEQDWGPIHIPEEKMNDSMNADRAIARLREKHDKPFFLCFGTFNPHMPWYVPQKYFDLFPLDEIVEPPMLENDLDDVPPLARELTVGKDKYVASVKEHGLLKEGVRAYLATTAYADAQMGRVLDALEKSPYRDNTIVVLLSDNGFHLGEKNHWQKATLWEEATHVMLMFHVPGMTKADGLCKRFVSLQDVYPTLVELCGLETPDYLDGKSLVPLLKDPEAPWRSTAISALAQPAGETAYVSIRTEQFRYTSYAEGQAEMYDCTKDPHEWTNLIDNPEYKSTIQKMRRMIPAIEDRTKPLPDPRRK